MTERVITLDGRTCSACATFLSYSNFRKNKTKTGGYETQCNDCADKRIKGIRRNIKKKLEGVTRIKPINPETGKPYVKGEMVGDKYVWGISTSSQNAEYNLALMTREAFIHRYCGETVTRKKRFIKHGKSDYDITITKEELLELIPKDLKCPILGLDLSFVPHKPNSIQLDRIDNSKGYVSGNVAWICAKANRSKSDCNSEELQKIVDWLKKQGL